MHGNYYWQQSSALNKNWISKLTTNQQQEKTEKQKQQQDNKWNKVQKQVNHLTCDAWNWEVGGGGGVVRREKRRGETMNKYQASKTVLTKMINLLKFCAKLQLHPETQNKNRQITE